MITNIKEVLEKLLDESDWDTLEMINDRGEHALFDQVCLIPESDSVIYAILQPVDEFGNWLDDEIVFSFTDADTDDAQIDVVTDQYLIKDIYDEYRRFRSSADTEYEDEDEEDYEDEEE